MSLDPLEQLTRDLAAAYNPPRWKFWRRRQTVARALAAMRSSLVGERPPIRRIRKR